MFFEGKNNAKFILDVVNVANEFLESFCDKNGSSSEHVSILSIFNCFFIGSVYYLLFHTGKRSFFAILPNLSTDLTSVDDVLLFFSTIVVQG